MENLELAERIVRTRGKAELRLAGGPQPEVLLHVAGAGAMDWLADESRTSS